MSDENDKTRDIELKEYELKIQLLSDLTKRWEYRHKFFWSSFFKLFVYYILLISAPIAYYFQFAKSSPGSNFLSSITILIALAITAFVVLYALPRSIIWLSNEENRQKIVLEKSRELYEEIFSGRYSIRPAGAIQGDDDLDSKSLPLKSTKELINTLSYSKNIGIGDFMFGLFRWSITCYALIMLAAASIAILNT